MFLYNLSAITWPLAVQNKGMKGKTSGYYSVFGILINISIDVNVQDSHKSPARFLVL